MNSLVPHPYERMIILEASTWKRCDEDRDEGVRGDDRLVIPRSWQPREASERNYDLGSFLPSNFSLSKRCAFSTLISTPCVLFFGPACGDF